MDAWYRAYAAKEMKDVQFCFAFVHDPGSLHSRKKVVLPTDVRGMKVRPATSTIGQMVTALGGTNVQSSAPEARDMLERGVADAITFPWGSLGLFGIDKVVTYHIDTPLYVTPFVWVLNKDKIASMSAAQKKVIDDHCTTEWAEKVVSPGPTSRPPAAPRSAAPPGTRWSSSHPSSSTRGARPWRRYRPVGRAEAKKRAGADPKQVLDALHQSLVKYQVRLVMRPATQTFRPLTLADRIIHVIEWLAASFVGIVAADIFLSVFLRKFFGTSIPTATTSAACCWAC